MNSVERVAKRTRELRKQHGLTQQEFAEIADMSEKTGVCGNRRHVGKISTQIEACRKTEIWLSTVEKIAAGFGLELDQFLAAEMPKISKLPKPAVSSRVHRK